MKLRKPYLLTFIALAGTLFLLAGIVLSIQSYNQRHSSPYSFANHFVSELGWSKMSQATAYFNWGMIAVNLSFLPMMIAIGRGIGTRIGYLAMIFGIFALTAGIGVGIWPLDDLRPHIICAIAFFWAYMLTVFLFTLAFCPRWNKNPSTTMLVTGIICCLIATAFVVLPKGSVIHAMKHLDTFQRPSIWWLAVLEWSVVGSALLWGSMATLVVWRK